MTEKKVNEKMRKNYFEEWKMGIYIFFPFYVIFEIYFLFSYFLFIYLLF